GVFSLTGVATFATFSLVTIIMTLLVIPLSHTFFLFFLMSVLIAGAAGVLLYERRELKKKIVEIQSKQISDGKAGGDFSETDSFRKIWSVLNHTTSKLPRLTKGELSGDLGA
ncbi:MAG: hypothetical protein ABI891_03405, partial [Acidobacteriota bacterium]